VQQLLAKDARFYPPWRAPERSFIHVPVLRLQGANDWGMGLARDRAFAALPLRRRRGNAFGWLDHLSVLIFNFDMKIAASYLFRPAMVRAIQLPPEKEDPTSEWTDSLHDLLEGFEWESSKNGSLAIFLPLRHPTFAAPGDWIVAGHSKGKKHIRVFKPEQFNETFMDAQLAPEHWQLEQERAPGNRVELQHVTTP
jgi:hypothetical protein